MLPRIDDWPISLASLPATRVSAGPSCVAGAGWVTGGVGLGVGLGAGGCGVRLRLAGRGRWTSVGCVGATVDPPATSGGPDGGPARTYADAASAAVTAMAATTPR